MIRSRSRNRGWRPSSFPPVNTVAPVASGTARVGQTLSCTDGTWTGDATITYEYQWRRNGSSIIGETANTYVLTVDDVGAAIDCVVTATNGAGEASQDSNNITLENSFLAVLATAEFDIDYTNAACYPGTGQTVSNVVSAPSSGALQSAYDFYLGADNTASATDPTFTGSAGDPAAYAALDGGDYMTLVSGANTAFLNGLHKTNAGTWTLVAALYFKSGGGAFLGTQNSTNPRILIQISALNFAQIQQRGSATVTGTGTAAATADADNIVIISHNQATNKTRFWMNTLTKEEVNHTFSTTTTNPSAVAQLLADGTGAARPGNGTRIYRIAMFNQFIDDAEAALIINAIAAKHPEGRYSFL